MKTLEQKFYGLPLWQWLLIAAGAYGVWKFVIEPKLSPATAPELPAAQPPALLPAPVETASLEPQPAVASTGVSGVEPPQRKMAGKLDLEALLEARGMGGNWGGGSIQ